MPFNAYVVNGALDTGTLNLNGVSAGTTTAGPAIDTSLVKDGSLSATVVVEAETNTLTMAAVWQGYDETAAAWVNLRESNNPAIVVLATGTGGDDAVVTTNIAAPMSAYGFRRVRCSILSAAAAGNTVDTYRIWYNYSRPTV